jgi:hypothetical protein
MDDMTRRVLIRFAATATIRWIRSPGKLRDLATLPGGGIYAKSSDGRFIIWVRKFITGDKGYRKDLFIYSIADYALPSAGQRYTEVPIRAPGATVLKKVEEIAEAWAAEHPVA